MKNNIIIIGLLFSTIFSSCTDWLDPKPLDTMVLEDFWQTREDVESVLLSCYEGMTQKDFMQRIILGGEIRSDNVTTGPATPSSTLAELLNEKIQPTNSFAKWDVFYMVINRCNNVIRYAPEVREIDPDYTEGLLNLDLAEAHTIRALVYFYLVRLYDKIPYITEPSIDDSQNYKVGNQVITPEEILRNELEYLKIAETGAAKTRGNVIISTTNARQTKGRITKSAVRALMADIYLWLGDHNEGDFENCIEACDKILAEQIIDGELDYNLINTIVDVTSLSGSELALLSNKTYPFRSSSLIFSSKNSIESIFELQFNSTNAGYEAYTDYYGATATGTGFSLYAYDLYGAGIFSADVNREDRDIRSRTSLMDITSRTDVFRNIKYVYDIMGSTGDGSINGSFVGASYPINWIFYRLPDIIFMKAEALMELGESNFPEALNLINRVYKRSNPEKPDLNINSYSSKPNLLALLLLERQREFLFEGKRWFDLVRIARREGTQVAAPYILRKHANEAETIRIKLSDLNAFYLPVPRDELQVNPQLKQNPYYLTNIQN